MILVTGSSGFLGRRVCLALRNRGLSHHETSLSQGLDLRDREATVKYFEELRPKHVINCAAFVGGIQFGYLHPAELFQNNLLMTLNILEASAKSGVDRIVNPISNCAYPKGATLFKEEEFWDGPLDESVLVYGFVRKASWVGSWAYAKQFNLDVFNLVLSNMYGPEDHFDEVRSHALGALVMKMVRAKDEQAPQVIVWGSGKPVREWLHVDDGAEAMLRALDANAQLDPVNVGVGRGISVWELACLIKDAVGYRGELVLDETKPDGAPYKTVSGTRGRLALGWSPDRSLKAGIKETVDWYVNNRRREN